jgi:hypothetical protein
MHTQVNLPAYLLTPENQPPPGLHTAVKEEINVQVLTELCNKLNISKWVYVCMHVYVCVQVLTELWNKLNMSE